MWGQNPLCWALVPILGWAPFSRTSSCFWQWSALVRVQMLFPWSLHETQHEQVPPPVGLQRRGRLIVELPQDIVAAEHQVSQHKAFHLNLLTLSSGSSAVSVVARLKSRHHEAISFHLCLLAFLFPADSLAPQQRHPLFESS